MEALPKKITIGDKYRPAMEMKQPWEANEYFEILVAHCMSWGHTREEAENIERQNLGYYAGYYDSGTRRRVEHLFSCAHPVFGKIAEREPSAALAFATGLTAGKEVSN